MKWDEEVQTTRGVLTVALTYTYETLAFSLSHPRNTSILRSTRISFDAGGRIGRFTHEFEHHRVDLVNFTGDSWFLVLETRGGPPYELLASGERQQIYGQPENAVGQKCWGLDASGFQHASIFDLPIDWAKPNLLMDYASIEELQEFDNRRVTLALKSEFNSRHPVSQPAGRIVRPQKTHTQGNVK